ncbi:MAG: nicotinamide mononucleotide transporter [Clostridia bacterium]|jgi:nicotinamide mononucleotide transporter PnuC|nr:nicotinamide mononucleotide transporter [Clostridia bacterium]
MIKKYFNDWNKFEKLFLICGLLVSVISAIIFNGTVIDTLYTSLYLITALLMSKGKVECYFVGFVSVFFYGIVSYNQGYYGELIITIFLTFPIMIIGIISWLRHQDKEEDTVIISSLSKKEITIVLLSQLILFWIYYFILKVFNTDLLEISTISVVTSVLASYFEARRSELSLFCYVANDLVIITLWLVPIINGQTQLISVLVGPILLLINDIYGSYNWGKLKKKQKERGLV